MICRYYTSIIYYIIRDFCWNHMILVWHPTTVHPCDQIREGLTDSTSMIGLSEKKDRIAWKPKRMEVRDVICLFKRVLLNQYIDRRSTDMKHWFQINLFIGPMDHGVHTVSVRGGVIQSRFLVLDSFFVFRRAHHYKQPTRTNSCDKFELNLALSYHSDLHYV